MELGLGTRKDLEEWMSLVEQVGEQVPGLETREALEAHRDTGLELMDRASALCARTRGELAGVLFARELPMLCFLAVTPEHRREHIAERLVSYALSLMGPSGDVTVTTFREGVPEGAAARAFYRSMGFAEGALTKNWESGPGICAGAVRGTFPALKGAFPPRPQKGACAWGRAGV